MNWLEFVTRLPTVIAAAMSVVQKIKSAKGPEKKQAVLEAIPESAALAEFGLGRDLLNDGEISGLVSAYIDAEKIAMKAKEALKTGILAKAPAPVVTP